MGLFSKKYDLELDPIRLEFNLEEKKYCPFYGPMPLKIEQLNRKSRKLLNEKNQMLIDNPVLMEQQIRIINEIKRFRVLKDLGYTCDTFEYLGEVNGSMSPEVEVFLNRITSEPGVLIGIHRVGKYITKDDIIDILNNGLKMTGHLGGAAGGQSILSNNVSYYPNNKTVIKELMYANNYKESIGSILIRIPDKDLAGDIFIIDDAGFTRLNPKYNIGFVPVDNTHHLDRIIKPEDYLSKEDEALANSLLEKYMKQNKLESNKSKARIK